MKKARVVMTRAFFIAPLLVPDLLLSDLCLHRGNFLCKPRLLSAP